MTGEGTCVQVSWIVALIVLACGVAHAQPARLLPHDITPGPVEDVAPDVDLITFGVGDRIFEKFGHAAICLRYHDPARPEVCFNYGVTNFDAGIELVWSFLRGQQKFWVEPESLDSLVDFYSWEDRDIWEQTLPFDEKARRQIEAKLWSDYEEANRYYVYDHFYDNCTTRVRDIIDAAGGGKLAAHGDERYPLTFRELGERGLASTPPLFAIADFVVGRTVDVHPTRWEAMFHPEVLRLSVTELYGAEPHLLYKRNGPEFPHQGGTGRWLFLVLAAVATLPLVIARWRKRFVRVATAWAVLYPGLWGLVLWTLVVLSSIPGVRWNEAVLVLVPFDLALPFLAEARRRRYARVRVVLLLAASLLCAVGVLRQPLWIPILTAIGPLAVIGFWP